MRGRRKMRWNWGMLTAAAVACSLCGMGCVYAAWSKKLESHVQLTTDSFSMVISGRETPTAYFVGADGEIAEECSVILTAGTGEKQGSFRITDGIFAELISMGGSLRIEFPIDCSDEHAYWKTGPSLVETEEELKSEQVWLLFGGDVFELPETWAEPFEKPVPCRIRTETVQQEEQDFGVVTITPSEAGIGILSDRPETLKMTEEEFSQLVPVNADQLEFQLDPEYSDGENIGTDTGIAVVYSLQCDLYLDQAGALEDEVELE